jgi:hypothetical protein
MKMHKISGMDSEYDHSMTWNPLDEDQGMNVLDSRGEGIDTYMKRELNRLKQMDLLGSVAVMQLSNAAELAS